MAGAGSLLEQTETYIFPSYDTLPMSDDERGAGRLRRRAVLGGAVGTLAVAGAGIGGLFLSTEQASAQVSGITADDVSVESGDGELETLTIAPTIDVQWNNFPDPVATIKVGAGAALAGNNPQPLGNKVVSVADPAPSGSMTVDLNAMSLLDQIDPQEFEDTTVDGVPAETDVVVSVGVIFFDSSEKRYDMVPQDQTTFTVSVNHLESTATVGGSMNTDGS